VSARISQTFGHFPQWTQNLFEVAIGFFSTPSISKDIFLFFQYLVKLINLIQIQHQDGFDSIVFFCKESRAIENKNNTSIRGRVSQNSSPKANEITNFENF